MDGWWLDRAADLLLGGRCVGCGSAGRVLCPPCGAGLSGRVAQRPPSPLPHGLVTCWSAGTYDGVLRSAVLAHKEQAVHALRTPLGGLLAAAVEHALPPGDTLALVPVPSRPGVARSRGHDPTVALTRVAAARLRAEGHDAVVASLLRSTRGAADQAGLDAAARSANVAGTLRCRPGRLRALAGRRPAVRVVVCDDVLTTGSTVREAQRALEAVGLPVRAVATVAATVRRATSTEARPRTDPPFPGRGEGARLR